MQVERKYEQWKEITESLKFYFGVSGQFRTTKYNESIKKEIIEISINVIKLAKKGINIPFYDILEMKEILLKTK